jgi:putative DNA-invertase from lambdoid prophage Rac
MRIIMAGLAEFERDLIRERVKSGLALAKANEKKLGRHPGQRWAADHIAAPTSLPAPSA